MTGAELLAALLPPVSYAPNAPRLQSTLRAEGAALDAAQRSADQVRASVTPFGAVETLPDWERVLGLAGIGGYAERLDAVLAKLAEIGGLSIPYFVALADRLGYSIRIDEPQPFRADASRAGDTVYIDDVIWCWQVIVENAWQMLRQYPFRAGASAAGDRVLTFGDPVIEAVVEDLKPGHTFAYVAYEGAPVVDVNFAAGEWDSRITFSRRDDRWEIVNGVLTRFGPDERVTMPDGWSVWPAGTNLRWPSENFSSGYTRRGTTIEASDIPLPKELGGVGWAIVETTENTPHDIYRNISVAAGKHSMLVVAHPRDLGGRNIVLFPYGSWGGLGNDIYFVFSPTGDLIHTGGGGLYEPPKVTKLSGGWLQFDCTATCTSSGVSGFYIQMRAGNTHIYPGNGTSKLHLAWSQVNSGYPIPYIPTTTGAVTRRADVASIQGQDFAEIWNPQEGAIIFDFVANNTTDDRTLFQWFAGPALGGTNRLYVNSIANTPYDPASLGAKNLGPLMPEGSCIGFAWRADDSLVSWHNGAKKGTTPLWPTDVGSMRLPGVSVPTLLRRLRIFNRRPSDAEMEALTS